MLTDILGRLALRETQMRELQPHEVLFRQGDPALHVFALECGKLKLVRHISDGRSAVMHIVNEAQTFAEAALFAETYHCSAVADIKSRVRMYSKKAVLEALMNDVPSLLGFTAQLSHQVQKLRALLELHNIQSARERILQFLLLEAGPGLLEVKLNASLKDIAGMLGLAHETLYRELAKLEDDKAIVRLNGIIKIVKVDEI